MTTGLIIARYQPAHVTHQEVMEFAKDQGVDRLVVVKGSADKFRIPRHPFMPEECTDMTRMYLERVGLPYSIHALADVSQNIKQDDEQLREEDIIEYTKFAELLVAQLPKFDVAIIANPTIGQPLARMGYPVIRPTSNIHCTATYVRREYTLHGDRCEDLLLPEQVRHMDTHNLYDVMKQIGKQEFR